MNGIELKDGVNTCDWNINGRCTNPKVTHNKTPEWSYRDWVSKQNCVYTIMGTKLCSGFKEGRGYDG